MKTSGAAVPNRHAVADLEPVRRHQRDLLLPEITVQAQRRDCRLGLAQNRPTRRADYRDIGTQVQRIAHQKLSRPDFNRPTTKPRDVVHGSLKRTIIRAQDVR